MRQLLGTPQTELAAALLCNQPAVSRFEKRDDVKLSTLVSYLDATGGSVLEIYPYQEAQGKRLAHNWAFGSIRWTAPLAACGAEGRILGTPKLTQWGRRALIQDPERHKSSA